MKYSLSAIGGYIFYGVAKETKKRMKLWHGYRAACVFEKILVEKMPCTEHTTYLNKFENACMQTQNL